MDPLFQYAAEEVAVGRPGSETVLAKLSELLFVEAVWGYAEALPDGQAGWLAGLREPHVVVRWPCCTATSPGVGPSMTLAARSGCRARRWLTVLAN